MKSFSGSQVNDLIHSFYTKGRTTVGAFFQEISGCPKGKYLTIQGPITSVVHFDAGNAIFYRKSTWLSTEWYKGIASYHELLVR